MRKTSLSSFFYIFGLTILLFVALLVGKDVFAQVDYGSGPRRDQNLQKFEQRREEQREKIATKTAQPRRERIERLKKVFNRILDRFSASLRRLDKIVAKLQRRIDKLNAKGVDTTAARAQLLACQSKRTAAEAAIADSRAKIAAIDPNSATVRETVRVAVDALHNSKRAIRDYHKCLVEVTRMLKAAKPKEGTSGAR